MKILTLKIETFYCRKVSVALCVLSMAVTLYTSVEAAPLLSGTGNEVDNSLTRVLVPAALEGKIEKIWIDYDAKVKGEVGIRIHVKYSVKNALNVPCSLQAYVVREDGHSMGYPGKNKYATQDGKSVLVLKTFTSPYDTATYPDSKLFFPYWAFNLEGNNPNRMKLSVLLVGQGKEFARSSMDFGYVLGKARQ